MSKECADCKYMSANTSACLRFPPQVVTFLRQYDGGDYYTEQLTMYPEVDVNGEACGEFEEDRG